MLQKQKEKMKRSKKKIAEKSWFL